MKLHVEFFLGQVWMKKHVYFKCYIIIFKAVFVIVFEIEIFRQILLLNSVIKLIRKEERSMFIWMVLGRLPVVWKRRRYVKELGVKARYCGEVAFERYISGPPLSSLPGLLAFSLARFRAGRCCCSLQRHWARVGFSHVLDSWLCCVLWLPNANGWAFRLSGLGGFP